MAFGSFRVKRGKKQKTKKNSSLFIYRTSSPDYGRFMTAEYLHIHDQGEYTKATIGGKDMLL
jgi:hypothetical protein